MGGRGKVVKQRMVHANTKCVSVLHTPRQGSPVRAASLVSPAIAGHC